MSLNGTDHFFIISREHEDESFGHITQREANIDSILNYVGCRQLKNILKNRRKWGHYCS
jgi:hypothetical protein